MNMKKSGNILLIILGVFIVIVLAALLFFGPSIIFFIGLLTEDTGKLDNPEKISAVVTEKQETLQDIVSQILNPEQDLDIVINIEKKELTDLNYPKNADEGAFDLEDIYRLSEELEIRKISGFKDSDVDMVIFETYSSGIAGSSDIKGFFYLEQDMTEDIFTSDYFGWHRGYEYSEIMEHWYYYDIWY